ncbi:MAG TPA: transglycosylase SLT domain-containing protein [Bacteroidota bacterium]|nr:transglycosylase SLT domain-containing protein [Bacteroidota bacterium]
MPVSPTIAPSAKAAAHGVTDAASKARLQKAVKQFESLFVEYMLKSMRSTVPKSDMDKDDYGGDMMEGMFDMELSKHISANSNLGIGEMLYRKLTGEDLPKSTPHEDYTLPPAAVSGGHAPSASVQQRVAGYNDSIQAAAQKFGVDSNLIKAVMASESGGMQYAESSKKAKGLMQLIDSTATDMGVQNVWNPEQNIFGGTKYLKQLLDKFQGSLPLAVASYNAGPAVVEKHGGVPAIKETKEYVNRVLNYLQVFEQQKEVSDDDN